MDRKSVMLSGRMSRGSDCNRNFRKFSNRNFREFSNRNFQFRKMTLLISRWKLVVQSCMTVMIKSSRNFIIVRPIKTSYFSCDFTKFRLVIFDSKLLFSKIERFRNSKIFMKMVCRSLLKRNFWIFVLI